MNILLLEPYHTGSHAAWAEGYASRSSHAIALMSLAGRHWKWRMHGGAVSLAGRFLADPFAPDLIVASDMLDLTVFLALTRERTAGVVTAVYFHENQLSYPWSRRDPDPAGGRDAHYGFINYASALAADAVLFNSAYHLESFFESLEAFLGSFPDYRETATIEAIRDRAGVLPLGLDLAAFDPHRGARRESGPPLILWNHRWEYDKNPDEFFRALTVLRDEGTAFETVLLGERFAEQPPAFDDGLKRLGARIVHAGFEESFGKYAAWLWRADVIPVTAVHDFFGASVVEALYCECCPILPNRLAYPEHIPGHLHGEYLYEDFDGLLGLLRRRVSMIEETRRIATSAFVRRYDWSVMAPAYDAYFSSLVERHRAGPDQERSNPPSGGSR
jgi:glycosyltransferase involved in cell wall biosynthesis